MSRFTHIKRGDHYPTYPANSLYSIQARVVTDLIGAVTIGTHLSKYFDSQTLVKIVYVLHVFWCVTIGTTVDSHSIEKILKTLCDRNLAKYILTGKPC